ncbi:hypothetical protein B0H13DRAFT_655095 [Mycena leptocephala]|nr:hypothetical protein B0H13DRAFT_655095 [Mycena leptocephala]
MGPMGRTCVRLRAGVGRNAIDNDSHYGLCHFVRSHGPGPGRSDGLSNFHASIVLDLSWMNNTNTFIYFLLYVHHKSQPGPEQIKSDFASWITHLRGKLLVFASLGSNSDEDQENQKNVSQPVERSTAPTGYIDGHTRR